MKAVIGVIGAIVVLAIAFFGYQYVKLQGAAQKWDEAQEIASESIVKDGNTWKIEMTSVLDHPIDDVWKAVVQPELLSERVDAFKRSELTEEGENRKVVRLDVQVLTLPRQSMVAEFLYDPEGKKIEMKTLKSQAQDIDATYELTASPDGKKTLLRYDAVATQKIAVPLPENVQKGALRELFVKTIQAIESGIAEEKQPKQEAPGEAVDATEGEVEVEDEEAPVSEGDAEGGDAEESEDEPTEATTSPEPA